MIQSAFVPVRDGSSGNLEAIHFDVESAFHRLARLVQNRGAHPYRYRTLPLFVTRFVTSVARIVNNSETLQKRRRNLTMTIETMAREFRYDGLRLPDINEKLSVDEVKIAYSATYPEITTAVVTGPEAIGHKLVYHFTKAIGTKG